MVLLCDGCEGKFNMSRLDPPLLEVPKGDWYCPRCLTGRCWADLDPRIGRKIRKVKPAQDRSCDYNPSTSSVDTIIGTIMTCKYSFAEGENSKCSLVYVISYDGNQEDDILTLEEVDKALQEIGDP
eukprot:7223237-Ditylum_brightwellii.AAC.1